MPTTKTQSFRTDSMGRINRNLFHRLLLGGVVLSIAVATATDSLAQSSPKPLIDPPIVDATQRPADADIRRISAPSEPYQVYVAQEDSFARCGPSGEDYRTDPLKHGQPLKVYVEAANGWLGVRPPEGSFCWVPGDKVRLSGSASNRSVENRDGVVVEDRLIAWIGTHLGRARRYRWQVRLAEGEPVTVLGKSERQGPDGPQTWYRIAPPSGEFRWVHRDQVVETTEQLIASVQNRNAVAGDEQIDVAGGYRSRQDGRSLQQASADGRRESSVVNTSEPDELVKIADQSSGVVGSGVKRKEQRVEGAEHGHGGALGDVASKLRQAVATAKSGLSELVNDGTVENSGVVANAGVNGQFTTRPRFRDIDDARDSGAVPTNNIVSSGFEARDGSSRTSRIGVSVPTPSSVPATASRWNSVATAPSTARVEPTQVSVNPAASGFGVAPASLASRSTADSGIAQVDHQSLTGMPQQYNPQSNLGTPTISVPSQQLQSAPAPTLRRMRSVSTQQIIAIENEVRSADLTSLTMILSRLMSQQASDAEVDPVRLAAESLASRSSKPEAARRIAKRAAQYQAVARQRDGDTLFRSGDNAPAVPSVGVVRNPVASASPVQQTAGLQLQESSVKLGPTKPLAILATPLGGQGKQLPGADDRPAGYIASGQLVQVYSARPNSPPYALTDTRGQTIAYVTPAPGTSLHNHLNSEIHVSGNQGYLEGMKTPHIVASNATRVR